MNYPRPVKSAIYSHEVHIGPGPDYQQNWSAPRKKLGEGSMMWAIEFLSELTNCPILEDAAFSSHIKDREFYADPDILRHLPEDGIITVYSWEAA